MVDLMLIILRLLLNYMIIAEILAFQLEHTLVMLQDILVDVVLEEVLTFQNWEETLDTLLDGLEQINITIKMNLAIIINKIVKGCMVEFDIKF